MAVFPTVFFTSFFFQPASNDQYISKIRKRLQEDATARQEREKRRRKVLVDQLKAHDAQEVRVVCIICAIYLLSGIVN